MLNLIISSSRNRFDPDARAWINAVEAADAQELEGGVKVAMNYLVVRLKSYSYWDAISTMTVRAGARTLAGALIDIKNPSSSWINGGGLFLPADYNRTTGLIGNGTTKYLDTGRSNSAEARNNQTFWTYVTSVASSADMAYIGAGIPQTDFGSSYILRSAISASNLTVTSRNYSGQTDAGGNAAGFMGIYRSDGTGFASLANGSTDTFTLASETPLNRNFFEYATSGSSSTPINFSNHRACAAGIGTVFNLNVMETELETYIATITSLGL